MLIYFLVQVSCTRTSPAVNRRRSSKSGDTPHRRTRRIHVRRAISYRNPENGSFNLVSGNFIFEIWKDMRYNNNKIIHTRSQETCPDEAEHFLAHLTCSQAQSHLSLHAVWHGSSQLRSDILYHNLSHLDL